MDTTLRTAMPPFASKTRGAAIGAWIDTAPEDEATAGILLGLLIEQAEVHAGRSTAEVTWIRGYAMAAFARTGMPAEALPFALEELQSGQHAYLIAAACIALRGMEAPPADLGVYLFKAYRNLRGMDEYVNFTGYGKFTADEHGGTGRSEILKTLEWLGPHAGEALADFQRVLVDTSFGLGLREKTRLQETLARMEASSREETTRGDCCCGTANPFSAFRKRMNRVASPPLPAIRLEDQDGQALRFGEFFNGAPSAVAFFYTRCDNPRKCSLTVSKLAMLQQELERRGLGERVKVAAFTYDPLFDTPERLHRFGTDRGFRFGPMARIFRTEGPIDELRDAFSLGVNFVGSIVNRHRLELHVLDSQGRIAGSFERLQWEVAEVADELEALLAGNTKGPPEDKGGQGAGPKRSFRLLPQTVRSLPSIIAPVAMALFPKCPVCLATWLGVFGIGGLQAAVLGPWLRALVVSLVVLHLMLVWRRTRRSGRRAAMVFSGVGAVSLFAATLWFDFPPLALVGVIGIGVGSFLAARGKACVGGVEGMVGRSVALAGR